MVGFPRSGGFFFAIAAYDSLAAGVLRGNNSRDEANLHEHHLGSARGSRNSGNRNEQLDAGGIETHQLLPAGQVVLDWE